MSERKVKNKHNIELQKLFKLRKSAILRLRRRGFKINDGTFNLPFSDFETLYNNNRHHLYFPEMKDLRSTEPEKVGVLVYFEPSEDFTKKNLLTRIEEINEKYKNLSKLFFALSKSTNKKTINSFVEGILQKPENSYVEILQNLYPFDIMESNNLPTSYLLTPEEGKKILELFKASPDNFSTIKPNDPLTIELGASLGDIIYIERTEDGEVDFCYRLVKKDK